MILEKTLPVACKFHLEICPWNLTYGPSAARRLQFHQFLGRRWKPLCISHRMEVPVLPSASHLEGRESLPSTLDLVSNSHFRCGRSTVLGTTELPVEGKLWRLHREILDPCGSLNPLVTACAQKNSSRSLRKTCGLRASFPVFLEAAGVKHQEMSNCHCHGLQT